MTQYLTSEQLIALHERGIRTYGGTAGIRDYGFLEAAITRPQASFSGFDAYPSVESKAAALFHSLVTTRPFVDGNKRAAAAALVIFLELNGLAQMAKQGELYALTMAVSAGRADEKVVAAWATTRWQRRS